MIKLFLAEDEIAMREGIKRLIHWEEEGIDFCGEAGDGELAWPQILEQRPDIVITDIKMPFMDGLELSRLIRKELPDTKIVILSGYGEFEYAQEALRIGVAEYLLKPITPKRLREVIGALADSIKEERKNKEEQFDLMLEEKREKDEHDRRRLLRTLISAESGTTQILSLADEIGLKLSALAYRILLVYISGEADYRKQQESDELLSKAAGDEEGCFLFGHSLDSSLILLTGKSDEDLEEKSSSLISRIISNVCTGRDMHYFICVSRTVFRLSEVHQAYQESYKAASSRFFLPSDQVIRSADPVMQRIRGENSGLINTETALQSDNLRTIWENFMRTGTEEEAKDFVDDVFASVGESNVQSAVFLNYLTVSCYFAMIRFLKGLDKDVEEVNEKRWDINSVIGQIKNAEDAKQYLTSYLEEVIRFRESNTSRKNSQMMVDALRYIDENYTDGSLSLMSAAAAAGLSPNRFSSIFSHEMGMTFIEYLIGKRMEKACELLMTTDLKSFEVAYNSGYNDPHYFSTTFKKMKGMSPMEYRKRGRSKEAGESEA